MSDDMITCWNCGKYVKKTKYCKECGAPISHFDEMEPPVSRPDERSAPQNVSQIPYFGKGIESKNGKMKLYNKLIIFLIVIAGIDAIVSYALLSSFQFTIDTFAPIFFGFFFLILLLGGVVWGSIEGGSAADMEGCGYAVGIILGIVLAAAMTPFYIANALPSIVPDIASRINDRIAEAVTNAASDVIDDVEVPGFEPIIFTFVISICSLLIIYRYHLKNKKHIIIK